MSTIFPQVLCREEVDRALEVLRSLPIGRASSFGRRGRKRCSAIGLRELCTPILVHMQSAAWVLLSLTVWAARMLMSTYGLFQAGLINQSPEAVQGYLRHLDAIHLPGGSLGALVRATVVDYDPVTGARQLGFAAQHIIAMQEHMRDLILDLVNKIAEVAEPVLLGLGIADTRPAAMGAAIFVIFVTSVIVLRLANRYIPPRARGGQALPLVSAVIMNAVTNAPLVTAVADGLEFLVTILYVAFARMHALFFRIQTPTQTPTQTPRRRPRRRRR